MHLTSSFSTWAGNLTHKKLGEIHDIRISRLYNKSIGDCARRYQEESVEGTKAGQAIME